MCPEWQKSLSDRVTTVTHSAISHCAINKRKKRSDMNEPRLGKCHSERRSISHSGGACLPHIPNHMLMQKCSHLSGLWLKGLKCPCQVQFSILLCHCLSLERGKKIFFQLIKVKRQTLQNTLPQMH